MANARSTGARAWLTLAAIGLLAATAEAQLDNLDLGFSPRAQSTAQGARAVKVKTFASQDGFRPGDRFQLALEITPPAHHHIGSNAPAGDDAAYLETVLTLSPPAGLTVDRQVFPPDIRKVLPVGAATLTLRVFTGRIVVGVEGRVGPNAPMGEQQIAGSLRHQLCDDVNNTCLPPKTTAVVFGLRVVAPGTPVQATHADVIGQVNWGPAPTASQPDEPESALPGGVAPGRQTELTEKIDQGLFAFLAYAAGVGLLSLLTPCVFPMIPITVSFFTKQAEQNQRGPWRMAAVYCLSIVAVFTLLGVVLAAFAGARGANDLAWNPWVNLVLGAVFVVFALMLFGAFEVRMPGWLINLTSRKGQGTSLAGVFFMALTFTLVSFTCTTPFVGSVLVLGARSGQWFYPTIGMVAYAVAFALPFFLLALFPSLLVRLPRSGAWLNSVKVVMGFLELALAAKFLSNTDLVWEVGVFTHDVVLALWALTGVAIAAYLVGLIRFPSDQKLQRVSGVRWGLAALWLVVGLYLGSGLSGRPLTWLVEAYLPPPRSDWLADYDQAVAQAKASGKPLFLDFTGVTCTNCRVMEETVFKAPTVAARLRSFVLVRLYTDRGASAKANAEMQHKRFGTVELPLYVVQTPEERTLGMIGYTLTEQEFADFLDRTLDKAGGAPAS